MIVSVTISDNRETEIVDAVRSVVEHVDRVLIVDTGITDGTIERAREVAGDKLAVEPHAWTDFSTARNTGIKAARALGATWILILDSDERFDFGDLDLRETLASTRADAVLIESVDGHYPKEKILRARSNARYVGPTHEALIGGSRMTLQGPTFSEIPKSNEQLTEKFTRDVELLKAYVEVNPDDPRWWYYLGASYEGIRDHTRAAEAFGQCVERRKIVGDEAAWAAYKQAEQLCILERFDEAIVAGVRGLSANATFAECAWIASVAAFRSGRIDQAVALARISEAVGRYKGCGVERAWFRHMPALYELPYDVLRFALPPGAEREEAEADFHDAKRTRLGASDDRDLDRLSISRSAPVHLRSEARTMLHSPPIAVLCPSARAIQVQFEAPDGWHPMNPAICRHNGELWCVVRTVNYSMSGRQYTIHDADGIVRTENYIGRLDIESGRLIDPKRMCDLDPSPRRRSHIVGYEDIRLVSLENGLSGSATVCDRVYNRRRIARLELDGDSNVTHAEVQPSNQEHEKNWMPLSVDGKLTWIYSLDPTAILPGPLRDCSFALEHLRGGAAISFDGGYLCVTHEVVEADAGRIYLHRFVKLDERFNVTAVSPTWVFAHHGIEFAAGIVVDGDEIILSYGIEDREAWITRVDVKEVRALKWITPEQDEVEDIDAEETLAATQELPGWMTVEKGQRIIQLVVESKAELCVELGVYGGRSLISIAAGLAHNGFGHVDGIDPYTPTAALEGSNDVANDEWWASQDYEGIARQAQEAIYRLGFAQYANLVRMRSREVVGFYADGSLDLLHQDSNHAEEVSCEEVALWAPKIKPGGLWLADDTNWESTKKAQRELEALGFEMLEDHKTWKVYRRR